MDPVQDEAWYSDPRLELPKTPSWLKGLRLRSLDESGRLYPTDLTRAATGGGGIVVYDVVVGGRAEEDAGRPVLCREKALAVLISIEDFRRLCEGYGVADGD